MRIQYAALPFRKSEVLQVLLITSRETGRWVVPKGWPMKGRSPSKAAALEALQEAGVDGEVASKPVGSYVYVKHGPGQKSWTCKVHVYPLQVRKERDRWREQKERVRQWFSARDAAEAVDEADLKAIILEFGARQG